MPIYIFAGTTEGRQICEFLSQEQIPATAFVATEYGALLLEALPFITIHTGRMDVEAMTVAISYNSLVIDATHPYAQIVTEHIQQATKIKKCQYMRLVRKEADVEGVSVTDSKGAATYLSTHEGKALLAIGAKELEVFTTVPDFQQRFFPRVLPDEESIARCRQLGFPKSSIIAMQGPFQESLNQALLEQYQCQYLVTKNSGKEGGVVEKEKAATAAGATLIIIQRPTEEIGWRMASLQAYIKTYWHKNLHQYFPLFVPCENRQVLIVGGGAVAQRRLLTLMQFSLNVTVVGEKGTELIKQWASDEKITFHERLFQAQDLLGKFMVIAATSDPVLNREIGIRCKKDHIYVSVASKKEESNFYFPAIFGWQDFLGATTSQGKNYELLAKGMKGFRESVMK